MNNSLTAIGVSPVTLHGKPKDCRIPTAKTKLNYAMDKLQEGFANVYVPIDDLKCHNVQSKLSKEICDKANDLDHLLDAMKVKLTTADYKTKLQILTLVPRSCSSKHMLLIISMSQST